VCFFRALKELVERILEAQDLARTQVMSTPFIVITIILYLLLILTLLLHVLIHLFLLLVLLLLLHQRLLLLLFSLI
jgi:hypothetical protein